MDEPDLDVGGNLVASKSQDQRQLPLFSPGMLRMTLPGGLWLKFKADKEVVTVWPLGSEAWGTTAPYSFTCASVMSW